VSVTYLPVWKSGATSAERFEELAQIAREHPERFARCLVIYEEDLPLASDETFPRTRTRWITSGKMPNREALGLLELGRESILRWIFTERDEDDD
jgi:hypothetical protein